MRAVGAGHSWSDVALTDGYLVKPDRLGGLLALDDGTLSADAHGRRLVRVLGGTHLHALNAALDRAGLALPNMGGYDAQTIAGVVATSTHGTGLRWGPFPDLCARSTSSSPAARWCASSRPTARPIRAVRRRLRRRAPADPGRRTFAAAACGIGCLGLIHSLVIEVREKFWLNEVRTCSHLGGVRGTLTADRRARRRRPLRAVRQPVRGQGRRPPRCVVTRRADCPEPAGSPRTSSSATR